MPVHVSGHGRCTWMSIPCCDVLGGHVNTMFLRQMCPSLAPAQAAAGIRDARGSTTGCRLLSADPSQVRLLLQSETSWHWLGEQF